MRIPVLFKFEISYLHRKFPDPQHAVSLCPVYTCLVDFFFGGGSLDPQYFVIVPLLGLLLQLLCLLNALLGSAEILVFVQG